MYPLTIYFDGACGVCRQEMDKFKARDKHQRLRFVDISQPGFEAGQFGLDRKQVRIYLHVKDSDGRLSRGVDAFAAIWQALGYKILPQLCRSVFVKPWARLFYRIFSRYRYFFSGQKSKARCDKGTCQWRRL